MSWTITDDEGVLQVRATLATPEEALDLIERLTEKYKIFAFGRPEPPSVPRPRAPEPGEA